MQALKNEALINSDIVFVNDRFGNGEKRLMSTLSQVFEMRKDENGEIKVLSGNAKIETDLSEIYNLLTIADCKKQ